MKGTGRKWKLLCAGLVAAGVLVAGIPGKPAPVAEAMYSSVDAAHHWYKTPNEEQKLLMLAIHDGDYATVKDLIDAGLDVNGVYDERGGEVTPLAVALYNQDREIMQLLLENGADPTGYYEFDGDYIPYLNLVIGRYRRHMGLEMIQYLHNWGADINAISTSPYDLKGNALTVLAYSAWNGGPSSDDIAIATYLIDQGINLEVVDKYKETPFVESVDGRDYALMDLLADRGANVYAKNRYNKNAAEIALDKRDLQLYKHVKALMERGNQPSNYTPPAGTAISIDNPKGSKNGNAVQSHAGRGTTASKYADVFAKYSEASEKIYNELSKELTRDMTKPDQKKAALSKEADAIKELKKLNEKMAKEDPLKGLKGYSVGEREKFTDAFDGIREKNEAMIAYMEYCVAHPDDAQEDQLTALTQAVLTAHETQKQRVDAVLALIKN